MKNTLKTEIPKKLHELQQFIIDNCENIRKMDKQLTFEQAEKLTEKYQKSLLEEKVMSMENLKGLHKKYISVYLTLNVWCGKY